MDTGFCPNCRVSFPLTPGMRLGWAAGAALGAATCGEATRNGFCALLGAVLGALLGHEAERRIVEACPDCGQLLLIASRLA